MRKRLICALGAITLLAAISAPSRGQGVTASPDCAKAMQKLEWAAGRLSDWPELGHYRQANRGVPPPGPQEKRVVFLGDSITDFWKLGDDFPGKPYINRGISGQTTPQMLVRFRPDVIDLKPMAVVILAGTNDIAGNTGPTTLEAIEENLATLVELARLHRIRVVLASVLPVAPSETRHRAPEKIRALNEWARTYAAQEKLTYLDYHSAMADGKGFLKAELSGDGLHPNRRGYAVMAPLAERAISAALRAP